MAIDGDLLIVGAPEDNTVGTNAGAAYVFLRSGGAWRQEAKLRAGDGVANATFGQSVAISGSTAFVGAAGGTVDAAYVFARSGSAWSQQAKLTAGGGDFGFSVGVSGTTAAVGAPGRAGTGQALVYTRSGNVWTAVATLTPSQGQSGERFGAAVAMTGTQIVIGAPLWDANGPDTEGVEHGRAFVFEGSGGSWTRVARLTQDGGLPENEALLELQADTHFGAAVAIGGNYAVIGGPKYDAKAPVSGNQSANSGAAWGYYRLPDVGSGAGPSWTRSSGPSGSGRLQANHPAGSDAPSGAPLPDNFGAAVAVAGGRIVTGLPGHNEINAGGNIVRPDVGAVRTFSTNDVVPAFSNASMRAEVLLDPTTQAVASRYGSVTHYDPASRMLFVGDPGQGVVYTYVNEGLFWRPVQTIAPDPVFITVEGLTARYYHPATPVNQFPDFNSLAPVVTQTEWAVSKGTGVGSFAGGVRADDFAARWTGQIMVTGSGNQNVTFYLGSDDGSRLYIDGTLVVDNGGLHGFQTLSGLSTLSPGLHNIEVQYFERNGGAGISLEYQVGGTRRILSGPVGGDIDVDGNWMVIGAPDAKAYVYQRSGETWSLYQQLTGSGGFGNSVAVGGNRIVVGMPGAVATYRSNGQADPNYDLPLGATGGAVVYSLNGWTWSQDRLLMPQDSGLWNDTSIWQTTAPSDWNQVELSGKGWYGIGGHFVNENNGLTLTMAPWTAVAAVDYTGGDWSWAWRTNYSDQFVTKTLPDYMNDDVEYIMVGTVQRSATGYLRVNGTWVSYSTGRTREMTTATTARGPRPAPRH